MGDVRNMYEREGIFAGPCSNQHLINHRRPACRHTVHMEASNNTISSIYALP